MVPARWGGFLTHSELTDSDESLAINHYVEGSRAYRQ